MRLDIVRRAGVIERLIVRRFWLALRPALFEKLRNRRLHLDQQFLVGGDGQGKRRASLIVDGPQRIGAQCGDERAEEVEGQVGGERW